MRPEMAHAKNKLEHPGFQRQGIFHKPQKRLSCFKRSKSKHKLVPSKVGIGANDCLTNGNYCTSVDVNASWRFHVFWGLIHISSMKFMGLRLAQVSDLALSFIWQWISRWAQAEAYSYVCCAFL